MKRTITINDYDVIEECLRDFTTYMEGLYIKPDTSFFSSELEAQLIEYYRSENPAVQAAYKKMIGTAVIQTCYDCPDIPQANKKKVAARMVNEVFQSMEVSKETFDYLCSRGRYAGMTPGTKSSIQEHQKAIREYKVVRKAQTTIRIKNILKKLGKRVALGATTFKATGSKVVTSIVLVANSLANVLLPKTVREKFKEKAEKIKTTVVAQAQNVLQKVENRLNETPAGKKVVTVVKKTATFISEVKEETLRTIDKGAEQVRRGLDIIKEKAQRGLTRLKSFFV